MSDLRSADDSNNLIQKVIDRAYELRFIVSMRLAGALMLVAIIAAASLAQTPPDSVVEREAMVKLMTLLNLRMSDLTFRDDYSAKDSFRLAAVADLMRHPYGTIAFVEQMKDACSPGKIEPLLTFAFDNLALERESDRHFIDETPRPENEAGINLFYRSNELNRLLIKADKYLYRSIPAAVDSTFVRLSTDERNFLLKEMKQNFMEDTLDEFRTAEEIDSIQSLEEDYTRRFVEFGTKIRKDFLLAAGIETAIDLYREITLFITDIKAGRINLNAALVDTAIIPSRVEGAEFLGKNKKWHIGGTGDDYYRGDYDFVFDPGGNDRYDLSCDPKNPHPVIIIDLSGDDIYNATTEFTLGSGVMNVGLLFDMGGNDIYNGGRFSCGSGYFGMGLLCDESGDDKYYGDTHTQGAGTFGLGAIIDGTGNDIYSAALYAQGFAGPEGMGLIVDYAGNDNYIAGNKYKDVLRYADHYLSLSQGFSTGFRPLVSGGIGTILDFAGNDTYVSDIFAQGASYWWSLGVIYDSSGNDQYLSYQYAQGSAAHMSLGLLLDESGRDMYYGKGLMQGCGHDYSFGMILDRNGDDIYHAYDLSQGAGSADGYGILLDNRGNDAYFVMRKDNTQGYGNPRRDFGSIGLMLDLGGTDRYNGNGIENGIWKTASRWGGGLDGEFFRKDSVTKK